MPIRALDRVTISFGLVSIPTKIYSTNVPTEHVSFHLLHADDGARVQQQWICSKDGEVIGREEMIKGYEYKKGKYVELSEEELDALAQQASDAIDIQEFVPLEAVDPIYVDRTYYLGPDKGGERAYALLARAMKKADLAGVASYAARGKAYTVLVRPFENGLLMHQLRYPDEIKGWEEVPIGELPRVKEGELELAEKVIAQLATDRFRPERYHDVVKDRIKQAIRKKLDGKEIVAPEPTKPAQVVDLMEALKATLGGKRAGGREAGGRRAARRGTKKPTKTRRRQG